MQYKSPPQGEEKLNAYSKARFKNFFFIFLHVCFAPETLMALLRSQTLYRIGYCSFYCMKADGNKCDTNC